MGIPSGLTKEEIEKLLETILLEELAKISPSAAASTTPIQEKLKKKQDMSKKAEERIDYSQWIKRGTSTFIPTDNAKTVEIVEPGVYNLRMSQSQGFYLFKKELHLDELLLLPSKAEDEVLESIEKFWSRKDKFKEYGFIYKRGILMYGPPGTGKTCLINIISQRMIEKNDGVVFIIQSGSDLELYARFIPEVFRTIEPTRPILTIIEDIDGFCTGGSLETELINVLDGIEQMDNVIYLATTNYTEKLPQRILNRPNRFDRRIKVGYPTAAVREAYLVSKLKQSDIDAIEKSAHPMRAWVEETKGFTLSHLGELIKSVVILDNTFEETLQVLKDLKTVPSSLSYNNEEEGGIGFSKGSEDKGWEPKDTYKSRASYNDEDQMCSDEICEAEDDDSGTGGTPDGVCTDEEFMPES